jgi:hypothetical protein
VKAEEKPLPPVEKRFRKLRALQTDKLYAYSIMT